MDLLSSVLSSLRVESIFISGWRLSEPWGVDVSAFDPGYCLTVLEGRCLVELSSGETLVLAVGDSLMAPLGGNCSIFSSAQANRINLDKLPWRGEKFRGLDAFTQPAAATHVTWGGCGATSRLLGLAFTFQQSTGDFLLSALPEFMILRHNEAGMFPLTQQAMDFLVDDTSPGYFAVARQLANLVIIGQLRSYLLSSENHPIGWLRGMQDRAIAKAMTAIHSHPEKAWTVAMLAAQANMSRSAFAARFTSLIGIPPIDYLHRWRISLAEEKLISTHESVANIAAALGYRSDRVFRHSFKKCTGLPPQKHRAKYRSR